MFLYKKVKKGIEYFYLRQTKRIKGKVVCEFQIYIGNKEKLYQVIQNGLNPVKTIPKPETTEVYHYGSVAVLLSLLNKLEAFKIIDSICKKRNQDMPVSYYLLSAAINRCIQAKSKNSISSWIKKTSLPNMIKDLDVKKLTSQHFWNHMNKIKDEDMEMIENELTKGVVKTYKLNLDSVLYDSTNFYSYIYTFNEGCNIEQRGKNKQHRVDLRQANFALLVTKEHHIPLYHKVYNGNENDYTGFQNTILSLKEKRDCLLSKRKDKNFTLIFDNGNVSDDNMKLINKYKFHFISKLRPSNHKELLMIPLKKYKVYSKDKAIRYYTVTKKLYGSDKTILIKYNKNHYEAEYKTLNNQVKEIQLELNILLKRLKGYIKKNKIPSNVNVNTVENNIKEIFKNRTSLKKLFNIELKVKDEKFPIINWALSQKKIKEYSDTYFGKTVYFTNISKISPEEIIETYSYNFQIEKIFKISKNRNHGCWWPKFHWTDQKIKVHAFYCYISLLLISLLELETKKMNIDRDIHSIIDELHGIYEVKDTYQNSNSKVFTLRRHSSLNKIQQLLFSHFKLGYYFKASK